MSNKITRFTLAKINAPISPGAKTPQTEVIVNNHDRAVLILSHNNADMCKCVPLGWDDPRISEWGFEVPAPMLTIQASPEQENKKIHAALGSNKTYSQTMAYLDDIKYLYVEATNSDTLTLYIPKWQVRAHFTVDGALISTEHYMPNKPVVHPIHNSRTK